MTAPISVLVVEDHALFRIGIRVGCNRDQSISVTGEAANGLEAVSKVSRLNPDVVLMDVNMPLMDGIETTRQIKQRNKNTKIIMLTSHDSDVVVQSALSAGASGFCLKDIDSALLCSAIKAVHGGEVWIDSSVAKRIDTMCMQSNTVKLTNQSGQAINSSAAVSFDGKWRFNESLSERYERLELIGRGGMSVVYKARHKILDKLVAVKVLAGHLSHIDAFVARFMQEARIASRLSHDNIASVHDFGVTQEGNAFLIMDFADGPSLADMLHQEGRISENKATEIFKQLSNALSYAHEQGVVHRDIKPANIIMSKTGGKSPQLKLVDFGLAKISSVENPKLTLNGEVVGSPLYMSPEQCLGLDVDHRSDIYSFGCLMYEVICGYTPFHGETALETFRMHVQEDYPDPPANLCSDRLKKILRKCLNKRPEDRFNSLSEMVSY